LCPHHCALAEGQTGRCRARRCIEGRISDINYGHITALALDPIEKKPLARFRPGGYVLSVGSFGCNMACPFCQNAAISMADEAIAGEELAPEQLVAMAVRLSKQPPGNIGLAFTYNEPLVGYGFVLDTARLSRAAGLQNVVVTNGQICREPWEKLLPYLDAVNIDLKAFRPELYAGLGGSLAAAKQAIAMAALYCEVEVTTLIVPGWNDSRQDMAAEAAWLAGISPTLPLHITRFFPRYHWREVAPTPLATLDVLCRTAEDYLQYVYRGNC
jgi:pyruvate formate lyase activating enzyme